MTQLEGQPAAPETELSFRQQLDAFRVQLESLQTRITSLEVNLAENTEAIKSIMVLVQEGMDLIATFKSAAKVLNWLGAVAKPIGYIISVVAAIAATYASIKEGWVR